MSPFIPAEPGLSPALRDLLTGIPDAALPHEGPYCQASSGEVAACLHRSCWRIGLFAPVYDDCDEHGLQLCTYYRTFWTDCLGDWVYSVLECGCLRLEQSSPGEEEEGTDEHYRPAGN